jgi:hypothetical protein
LYTPCVLGLRPSALFFNKSLLIQKKNFDARGNGSSHGKGCAILRV